MRQLFGNLSPCLLKTTSIITVFAVLLLSGVSKSEQSGISVPDSTKLESDTLKIDTASVDTNDTADKMPGASISDSLISNESDSSLQVFNIDSLREKREQEIADSITADSLERTEFQDSLLKRKAYLKSIYRRFPENIDSFYNPARYYSYQLYASDGSGISEALRFAPIAISVPIALSSSLNRFLHYGYPAGTGSIRLANDIAPTFSDPIIGSDIYTTAEVASFEYNMLDPITCYQHPYDLLSPEMLLFWENGVFRENLLGVRFARPIAEQVQLAVFSSYRFIQHDEYSHGKGDIYNSFKNAYDFFGFDSSLVANDGVNPLTDEHSLGFNINWNSKKSSYGYLSYKYSDLKNELLFQNQQDYITPDTAVLLWERLTQYRNDLRFGLNRISFKPILFDLNLSFDKDVNQRSPLSGLYWDETNERRGNELQFGAAVRPYVTLGKDTLSIKYLFTKSNKALYNGNSWESLDQNVSAGYLRPFNFKKVSGHLSGNVGHRFLTIEDSSGNVWNWQVSLESMIDNQRISLYATRNALAYSIPFDVSEKVPGLLFDSYDGYGAEMFLNYKKIGIILGYTYLADISPSTISHSWPHGMPPFTQPKSVITVAPVFGKWHGLSLSSRWMFSDEKPLAKSQTALRYDILASKGRQHILLDLVLDYWSDRDPVRYGSPDDWDIWTREIYDLFFKTTIQIKAFRLFYKVDNLLNRQIAYVPGYVMPGLNFRWGFNWLIKG